MRTLVVLTAAALVLTGCDEDRARAVAGCELQSEQFRHERLSKSIDVADDILLCMRARGFIYSGEADACRRVSLEDGGNALCYRAADTDTIDWLFSSDRHLTR